MRSNYLAARENLEKAYEHLQADDETSRKMREAIGILIDAMVVVQFKRKGQVLEFPLKQPPRAASPQSTMPEGMSVQPSRGKGYRNRE